MRAITLRDLEDLGDERFEELVAAMVLAKHPGAEQLGGKDGGADILLDRPPGRAVVWQVKHYPRTIHWEHCVASLDTAVAKHQPAEVVFVFPRNMSQAVKKSFREKLQGRHPGVAVSYLSGSQVIAGLRRSDLGLVEEFFGPDPADQARVLVDQLGSKGMMLSRRPGRDPFTERFELAHDAGRRDRQYRTEVSLTTGDAPAPGWDEKPFLVLTHKDESDRSLRIAAWPEKGRGKAQLEVYFDEGKKGAEARQRLRYLLAADGVAELPDGAHVRLQGTPAAVEAISDGRELEHATITAPRELEVKLVGDLDGQRIERTLGLSRVPGPDDSEEGAEFSWFGRLDGAVAFFIGYRIREKAISFAINLFLHAIDTTACRDLAEGARLLVANDRGDVTMEVPEWELGPIALGSVAGEDAALEHRQAARLLQSLAVIQEALGVPDFEIGAEISPEEAEAAENLAEALESGRFFYECIEVGGETNTEADLEGHRTEPAIVRIEATAEVFGRRLNFGIVEGEVPPPSSILVEGLGAGSQMVRMRWDEKPVIAVKLISGPGSPNPPQAGIWLPHELPALPAEDEAGG